MTPTKSSDCNPDAPASFEATTGSAIVTRFKCVVCGKLSAGRMPRINSRNEGDTTARWPRWHAVNGKVCDGNFKEAEWVDVPVKPNVKALPRLPDSAAKTEQKGNKL